MGTAYSAVDVEAAVHADLQVPDQPVGLAYAIMNFTRQIVPNHVLICVLWCGVHGGTSCGTPMCDVRNCLHEY